MPQQPIAILGDRFSGLRRNPATAMAGQIKTALFAAKRPHHPQGDIQDARQHRAHNVIGGKAGQDYATGKRGGDELAHPATATGATAASMTFAPGVTLSGHVVLTKRSEREREAPHAHGETCHRRGRKLGRGGAVE